MTHELTTTPALTPNRGMSRRQFGILGASAIAGLAAAATITKALAAPVAAEVEYAWTTVWEDRFDGTALDESNWTVYDSAGQTDLRDQQWNHPSMVSVEDGRLVLRAQDVATNGFAYRGGTLTTRDKVNLGPSGRLTTRQYVRPGAGVGLGVVLFGANLSQVGWPQAGEIDATELALARPGAPFASIHGPGYSGENPISATYDGALDSLLNRWVEHSLEWEPGKLTWAIDGEVYHEASSSDPRAAGGWPFDQEQFLVLTMTVGSWASGDVDLSTWPIDGNGIHTARAEFDFVRFEQYLPC